MLTCRELDRNSAQDIEAYEKAQYLAFVNTSIQSLDAIWEFDHIAKRLKANIPYSSQRISIVQHEGVTIGAMAVNIDMSQPLQLETLGFSIDKDEPFCAEGLGIFCNEVFIDGIPPLFSLREFTNPFLRSIGVYKVYGTCSEHRLKGYRLLGFNDIGMKLFKSEKKYLIVIDIPA